MLKSFYFYSGVEGGFQSVFGIGLESSDSSSEDPLPFKKNPSLDKEEPADPNVWAEFEVDFPFKCQFPASDESAVSTEEFLEACTEAIKVYGEFITCIANKI